MDDLVASVLEDAFPDREVKDVHPTGPSWNEQNRTVEIEFVGGKRVYLKIAADGDGSRIARERAAIAYVRANGDMPVPEILASDSDEPIPYLVTAPVVGTPLIDRWAAASATDRAALASKVGAALASVHDDRFDTHGRIVGGDERNLTLDRGPWTDVLIDEIREYREIAPSDRFDDHFDRVIESVHSNRAVLNDAPATLCHGDPAGPNCFCGETGIGLLDWELAHVGDPARELHRARNQQLDSLRKRGPEALVRALYDGYRERAGKLPAGFEERRPVYDAVRFLGVSGFFEKQAAYADEPAERVAAWVEREMDRRLAPIE